ncbi:MAG: hypothetical protein ACFFCV_18460 [Promethearchaeota archaeon]
MRTKIPDIPNSIILTTMEEMSNFENIDSVKDKILSYTNNEDFEQYMVKVLAAKKIGNIKYSELMFSIDPGTKHLGLVIYLNDFYLNSHTIYNRERFIEKVRMYIKALQETNSIPLKLIFKFGKGIMPITQNLIQQLFINIKENSFRIILIDESKTSKYKIRDENNKKIPKDEAAALIISLRDGFEITFDNYQAILKNNSTMKNEEYLSKTAKYNNDFDSKLIEIAEAILSGNLSLSKSIELLNTEKIFF